MPKIAKIPVMPTASLTCFNDANVIFDNFSRYFVAVIKITRIQMEILCRTPCRVNHFST